MSNQPGLMDRLPEAGVARIIFVLLVAPLLVVIGAFRYAVAGILALVWLLLSAVAGLVQRAVRAVWKPAPPAE